jgi:agmatinase
MSDKGSLAVLGVPLDLNSSYLRGTAHAPQKIREALLCESTNLCTESGLDLGMEDRWRDRGDVGTVDDQPTFKEIEGRIGGLMAVGNRIVSLGGDHSITWPLVRAHAAVHLGLTILHLDAHPDLYDEFEGSTTSHACPFARIMEERLASRLVSIGIRGSNPHQHRQAEKFAVETIPAGDDWREVVASLHGPLYLSLDLDVLDPAFAPGLSHPEPGGLSTREVLRIIQSLPEAPIGADIVELNPERDPAGQTAMVAAKLLKEVIARMLD